MGGDGGHDLLLAKCGATEREYQSQRQQDSSQFKMRFHGDDPLHDCLSGRVPTNRTSQRGEPQYTGFLVRFSGNAIVVWKEENNS